MFAITFAEYQTQRFSLLNTEFSVWLAIKRIITVKFKV